MGRPPHLEAECMKCMGLCCVAPNFEAGSGFAYDKPAGEPCRHLQEDNRCEIHDHLNDRGFPGCVAYECYGAGQRITQDLFPGLSWRQDPNTARTIFDVYFAVKSLHELMTYLEEAHELASEPDIRGRIRSKVDEFNALAGLGIEVLSRFDVESGRAETRELISLVASARQVPRWHGEG